ncbi:penicillin-binding transpeptidase domain-containing protein [Anaerotalea alkaliphila]|uniref:Penicillin-binding protein n=1 Tax=Anaerotalea alkaliphila TaxID=2662126 RepID=A0A7X5HWI5_9FIRM|nr:penicillin-binding transpeptidase domain-containing protein [Anaerotalea alkaliphila]NDL67948.1 hypothetical protein [Anaerotalea alkaliphila]
MKHRLLVMAILAVALFYVLVARLFELQIIEGARLEERFELSVLKEIQTTGKRGNIYDRNGYPLAENTTAFSVFYDDSVTVADRNGMFHNLVRIIRRNGDDIIQTLPFALNEDKRLVFTQSGAQVLRFKRELFNRRELTEEQAAMDAYGIYRYMKDRMFVIEDSSYTMEENLDILSIRYALWQKRYSKFLPQEISYDISQETLAEVEEMRDMLPGVSIQESSLRLYHDAEYFAHIIGYTSKIDQETLETLKPEGYTANDIIGKIGIERAMESYLKGIDGKQMVEVDNLGRTMKVVETLESAAGKDVYLTLDTELQKVSQDALVEQLASILVEKLSIRRPTSGDNRVPLLKDAFKNLFTNNTIDIERLELGETPSQAALYRSFRNQYEGILARLGNVLHQNALHQDKQMELTISYVLRNLSGDGVLEDGYRKTDAYKEFDSGKMGFKQMMEALFKEGYLSASGQWTGVDTKDFESVYAHVADTLIMGGYVQNKSYHKALYEHFAANEQLSYVDMTRTLIDQGAVTATAEEISRLASRGLSPLEFIKRKVASLELTPAQLALDPSSGAVVVTDVNTGDVLSLVSYPGYDNNRLVNNFDYGYYVELLNDPAKPLFPMATQGKTAPGSTFKMLTAVAGLEEKVITDRETVRCTGRFTKINPSIACWIAAYGGSHGPVTVRTALAVSCNTYFNEVGYRLGTKGSSRYVPQNGIDKLVEYAEKFGLDKTTGIELPETTPSLPGSVEGGIANPVAAAMGQEYNSYTPAQIGRYLTTLANGGTLFDLTLLDQVKTPDGLTYLKQEPQVVMQSEFSANTLKAVYEGMWEVANGSRGTFRSTFQGFPVTVAAKTGTAQQIKTRPSHAITVAYAPYEAPEIAVTVVIPFGYTAQYGGKVAKEIFSHYFQVEGQSEGGYTTDHVLD